MLEILLNNPILIVILIGALSSIFKNRDKKAPTEPVKTLRPKHEEAFPNASPKPAPVENTRPSLSMAEEKQKMNEPIKQEFPNNELIEAYNRKRAAAESSLNQPFQAVRPQNAIASPRRQNKIDKKAVINGIIWSEILGQPRSKNPYQPAAYRKNHN